MIFYDFNTELCRAMSDSDTSGATDGLSINQMLTVIGLICIIGYSIQIARAPPGAQPKNAWRNLTTCIYLVMICVTAWVAA